MKNYDEMTLALLLALLDKPRRDPEDVAELRRRVPALPVGPDGKPDLTLAARFEAHVAALRSNGLGYRGNEYLGARLVKLDDWLRAPVVELVCEPYTRHPLDGGVDPETELTFPVEDPVQMSQHAWLAEHLPALTPNFACSDAEQVESLIEQVAGRKPQTRNTVVLLKRWRGAPEQDRKRAERRLKPAAAEEAAALEEAPPPPPPPLPPVGWQPEVLVVYASEDVRHFDALRLHMGDAARVVDFRRDVRVGADAEEARAAMLQRARVVAMLISANLLGEMPVAQIIAQARAAGARVVPVVVRPVAWKGTVGDLAGLPRNERPITQWSDADAAWVEVTAGLKAILAVVVGAR